MEEDSRTASVRKKRNRNDDGEDADFVMLSSDSEELSDAISNKRRKGQNGKVVYDISSDESGEIHEPENVKTKNGVIVIDHDDDEDEEDDDYLGTTEEAVTDSKSTERLQSPLTADERIFCTPSHSLRDVIASGDAMVLATAKPVQGVDIIPPKGKPTKRGRTRVDMARFVGTHLSKGLHAASVAKNIPLQWLQLFPPPHKTEVIIVLAYDDEESRDLAVAITESTHPDENGMLYRARPVTVDMFPASAQSNRRQTKEQSKYKSALAAKDKRPAEPILTKAERRRQRQQKNKVSDTRQSSSSTDADLVNASVTSKLIPAMQSGVSTASASNSKLSSIHATLPTHNLPPVNKQTVRQTRHNDLQAGSDYRLASLTYTPRPTDPENPFEKFTHPPLSLPEYPILVQELDEEEQLEQERYFQLSDSDQVACLICDGRGHQEDHCPERTCRHCNAIDLHFAHTCPVQRKCTRCHERGHIEDECTSKLRNTEPPPCDICSGVHHEEDCPWRFRKMPESNLALCEISDVLIVSCHKCGTSRKHLTDDCPIRDTREPLHVQWSCWSAEYAKHFATAKAWAKAGLRLSGYHGEMLDRLGAAVSTAKPLGKQTKKTAVAIAQLTQKPTRAQQAPRHNEPPEYDDFSHLDSRLQRRADTYSPPPGRHPVQSRTDHYAPSKRNYHDDHEDDRYDDYSRDRYAPFTNDRDGYSRRDHYEPDYAPPRSHEYGYGSRNSAAAAPNANYGYGPVSGSTKKSAAASYHSVPPPQSLESRISGRGGGAAGYRGGKHSQNNAAAAAAKKKPIDEARERFAGGGGGGGGRGKTKGRGRGK